MTNAETVDQVRATFAAFEAGERTLAELEAALSTALQSGLWAPSLMMGVLRNAVAAGRVPADMLRRLGLEEVGDATVSRAIEWSSASMYSAAPPLAEEPIAIGQLLAGRYRLERKLGEGGMGVVYLASDQEVKGEIFAIKVLTDVFRQSPEALKLLLEETRMTRALAHPNIVGVYSLNVDRNGAFILMEFLEGKTLQGLLDQDFGRGMRFDRAWPIIEDMGAALAYAHDRSVIHGDLKPANVFVTTSGRAKLLDFGIARAARGSRKGTDTLARSALTPAYASCEMLEFLIPDHRDDIYALACIIYEMLSGKHPFGGRNAVEARNAGEKPTPISALTDRQNATLAQGLAFDRASRTTTVEALLAGLAPGVGPGKRGAVLSKAATIAAVLAMVAVALAYFLADKLWLSKRAEQPPTAVTNITTDKSIAVLPFADMSETHDQEYLGDGMAEEIINLLVKIPELKVIGRTSSFSFKKKETDLPSIGKALGVAYIVEGSIRRSSDRVRVTAQLVDARDGSHRWSDTFDGNASDVLRLQNEIALRVAHALNVEVASLPPTRATPASPEAYDYYLRGLHELDEFASDSINAARGHFQKALAIDPNFGPAAVGIAETDEYMCVDVIQPSVSCPRAHASVDAALKLDPHSADAYAMRAEILTVYDWDWDGAAAAITKATDLGGGTLSKYAEARLAYAIGDMARARQALQQIMTNNPFEPDAMFDMGFLVEFRSGNFEIAESWIRRALGIVPRYSGGLGMLGQTQLAQGKLDEALASMKQENVDDGRLPGLVAVYWAMNRKADSDAALSAMERNDAYPPSDFARVYAFRNERERALNYLEKAYEIHDPELWYIKGDPIFRNLESDPRFKAFLRKMNLQG